MKPPVKKKQKLHVCPVCKGKFVKFQSTQKACSVPCALIIGRKEQARLAEKKAKAERQRLKERREKARPLSWFRAKAQAAFNAYIRARDEADGCISCDKPAGWDGQWHAGHFYTRAARSDLAFNEDNVHKQCSVCNNHLSGNLAAYQESLKAKIGADRLAALDIRQVIKPTREYYQEISDCYRKKMKEIKGD